MRIAFLLQASEHAPHGPRLARVTAETVDRLRARGVQVDLLVAGADVLDVTGLRPQHDLYVLKSKAPLTHSLAGALTTLGAPVVNSYRASILTWDKVATTAVLATAGIPVPRSWATGQASALHPLMDQGPLWLKPQHGKSGSGVQRVDTLAALEAGDWEAVDPYGYPMPVFAQRDVPSGGQDFKVYVVGQQAWALVKHWPPRSPQDKLGIVVPLPAAIRAAALAVGRALGLELYGVDFLLLQDGSGEFAVVDVNAFPGYNGLDEAPAALADYLFQRARMGAVAWG